MADQAPPGPPVIPPDWYVDRFNAAAFRDGRPLRSALDPVLMMAWHLASDPGPSTFCQGLPVL